MLFSKCASSNYTVVRTTHTYTVDKLACVLSARMGARVCPLACVFMRVRNAFDALVVRAHVRQYGVTLKEREEKYEGGKVNVVGSD